MNGDIDNISSRMYADIERAKYELFNGGDTETAAKVLGQIYEKCLPTYEP